MASKPILIPPNGKRLILASASPRRRDLLDQIGVAVDRVDPADLDESATDRELPPAYARRMAAEKCEAVAARHPDAFVLAADTVVAVGRRILPKTESEAEARRCLDLLSGRRHRVLGAVALGLPDGRRIERMVTTAVTFKRLDAAEARAYLATGEWAGKAGGYAIQGLAAAFVSSVSGSYSNVVGLGLSETWTLLVGAGFTMTETDAVG